jgi:hypothetical protein
MHNHRHGACVCFVRLWTRIAGLSDFGVNRTRVNLRPASGKDITLSTLTEGMDILLTPNGTGRIRIGGAVVGSSSKSSGVISAIDKSLTLRSSRNASSTSSAKDLLLQFGSGKAVVIERGGLVVSVENSDFLLQTRTAASNIRLYPAQTGLVAAGTEIQSLSTA